MLRTRQDALRSGPYLDLEIPVSVCVAAFGEELSMSSYDVGIIGAGVHGCATAFHLASRGLRVALFERSTPASGPTGRSDAVCATYLDNPFLARCARDSIEMLRAFPELTGGEAGWHSSGNLFLHGPDDVEAVSRSAVALSGLGIEFDVLMPDEIAARFPQLDLTGVGVGVWTEDGGYADPAGVTMGFFAAAVKRGVAHHLHQRVEAVRLADQGGVTLEVGNERVHCARVLVAAGPWTRGLLRSAGLDLPLTVVRHFVGAFRWGGAERVPIISDLNGGFYLRPEGTELFIAGLNGPEGHVEEVDPEAAPRTVTDDELLHVASLFIRRIPALELASVQSRWGCMYDVSPDHQPVVGEVAPDVYVDAGTSGFGFLTAPALGRHVADLLSGAEPDPGLKEFHPLRFAEGRSVASPVPGHGNW